MVKAAQQGGEAPAKAEPVAVEEVDVISIYPNYILVVDRGQKGLAEMANGTMAQIDRAAHRRVEFKKHRAKMLKPDFDKVKARDGRGYSREWISLADYKAMRKSNPKAARAFKIEFTNRLKTYPPRDMLHFRRNQAAAEEYVDEVFQE